MCLLAPLLTILPAVCVSAYQHYEGVCYQHTLNIIIWFSLVIVPTN